MSALPSVTGLFLLPPSALVLSCAGSQGSAADCKTGKQWLLWLSPTLPCSVNTPFPFLLGFGSCFEAVRERTSPGSQRQLLADSSWLSPGAFFWVALPGFPAFSLVFSTTGLLRSLPSGQHIEPVVVKTFLGTRAQS